MGETMAFTINSRIFLRFLIILIGGLFILNGIGIVSRVVFDVYPDSRIYKIFDFNCERNIPSVFSFLLMLTSSLFLSVIFKTNKVNKRPFVLWGVLSFVFLMLGLDELLSIHEKIGWLLEEKVQTTGMFYFAWVIPYGIGTVIFLGMYIRFLLLLPRRIAQLFLIGGGMFVAGALGLEMLAGQYAESYSKDFLLYHVMYSIEELLEMLGIAVFNYALVEYFFGQFPQLSFVQKKQNDG